MLGYGGSGCGDGWWRRGLGGCRGSCGDVGCAVVLVVVVALAVVARKRVRCKGGEATLLNVKAG